METRARGSERERSVSVDERGFGCPTTPRGRDRNARANTVRNKRKKCGCQYKSVDHFPAASSLFRISIRRLALVSNSPSYPSNGTHKSSMSIPAALHFSIASYWFVRI